MIQPNHLRANACPCRHTASPGQLRGLAIGAQQIEQGEWDIFRMPRQRFADRSAGFFVRLGIGSSCAQIAKHFKPPFPDYLVGDFMYRCEHSADAARRCLIRHRTISHRKVRLFRIVFALNMELNIVHPSGRTAVKRRIDERLQHAPNFGPTFSYGLSQRPGVLCTKNGPICFVVDGNVIRAPPEKERKTVCQKKADHHPQTG